jgi:hypothetical protein
MQVTFQKMYSLVRSPGALDGAMTPNAPLYGEITAMSFQRILEAFIRHGGTHPNDIFCDIGSGRGYPGMHGVFASRQFLYSLGIEIDENRYHQSLANQYMVDSCFGPVANACKVCFIKGDAYQRTAFDPATHLFCFDNGATPENLGDMLAVLSRSTTVRYIVTFKSIHQWREAICPEGVPAFEDMFEHVETLSLKMFGTLSNSIFQES